jgi:hypothetical protein
LGLSHVGLSVPVAVDGDEFLQKLSGLVDEQGRQDGVGGADCEIEV